jgi:hypothetical protein
MSDQRYIKSNDAVQVQQGCVIWQVSIIHLNKRESNAILMDQMDCGNTEILPSEVSMP